MKKVGTIFWTDWPSILAVREFFSEQNKNPPLAGFYFDDEGGALGYLYSTSLNPLGTKIGLTVFKKPTTWGEFLCD
jgi:hypothetical protein